MQETNPEGDVLSLSKQMTLVVYTKALLRALSGLRGKSSSTPLPSCPLCLSIPAQPTALNPEGGVLSLSK